MLRATISNILVLVFCIEATIAAEVTRASVEHQGGVYRVSFEVNLEAEPDRVREIVEDYDKLRELTPTVVHSEVLSREDGRVRLDLRLRPCFWRIFCRSMRKVTDVTMMQDGSFHHRTVASESDFSFAEERLWIQAGASHNGTHARYEAELVPKFFIPPFIGPWLVRKQIVNELTTTANKIEQIAKQ